MKPVRNFLIAFAVVYIAAGLGVNLLLGPPGYSSDFMEIYKDDVDRYQEIVKSESYKLWSENSSLNPPDAALENNIAFIESFRSNPDFEAEARRRGRYNVITDMFRALMLAILVIQLTRGPISSFVKGLVTAERRRIETVERTRSAAARRKAEADGKLAQIEEEHTKLERQVADRIEEETAQIEASTENTLDLLQREADDRRRQEALLARRRVKAMLVDEAIAMLERQLCESPEPDQDAALIDQFVSELGNRR